MDEEEISMKIVNPRAAGIDIGSRSHWVAIGQGKKTDIQDCQWIQKLHSLGLLSSSFLPDEKTEHLRTLCRHRSGLQDNAASTSKKMQKYLRLLNLRLDVVVKDVCGQTGLKIIKAICSGETDSEKLSDFRHYNCRKSKDEISRALKTNGRKDYLFALNQELEMYEMLESKIIQCDEEIGKFLHEIIDNDPDKKQYYIEEKPHKRVNKNDPKNIDLNLMSYQYFEGIDLMAIEGMSHLTVLSLMSEVGFEGIRRFPTAKHFVSWLRFAPNNKISGGKVLSSKVPKGSSRLKIALRLAANAIGNLKDSTPLSDFFKRINFRKGRVSAISATARKLAVIWNMVVKCISYNNPEGYLYLDQKRKLGIVKRINKQISRYGLSTEDLNLVTS